MALARSPTSPPPREDASEQRPQLGPERFSLEATDLPFRHESQPTTHISPSAQITALGKLCIKILSLLSFMEGWKDAPRAYSYLHAGFATINLPL